MEKHRNATIIATYTTCYNFNNMLQNACKSFRIPKIEPYYTCYRGITCNYIFGLYGIFWNVNVLCFLYLFDEFDVFSIFCHVLHNFPFYRGITCIYLEYVEYSESFMLFRCFVFFVMLYRIFHFMEA